MAFISIPHFSLFIYLSAAILSTLLPLQAHNHGGLSIKSSLIHRDSPFSPLYNPQITHFNRLQKSFRRSILRTRSLINPNSISNKAFQSDISPGGGEYFIRIFIGTPQVEVLAIADTGSDLIWIQCQPCDLCYNQKSPIFDPRQSSSYSDVLCNTRFCNRLNSEARSCASGGFDRTCGYSYSYGDHSFSNGHLALERFGIGSNSSNGGNSTSTSPVYIDQIAFGCGTRNGGSFDGSGSGIVGLGGGSMSLVSQLGTKIGGKFSYCLVPLETNLSTSKITFGAVEIPISSSDSKFSTPLVTKDPETYYYLTLEAISVGSTKLAYKSSWINGNNENGNIIIDSGTTLTFLDSEFFNQLDSVIEASVKAERASDPNGIFSICFRAKEDIVFPIITAHFSNADVELQPINTFAQVEQDLVCFTMIPSNDISIFGNLAQINFLVGYDLHKHTVSFIPTDCTKL